MTDEELEKKWTGLTREERLEFFQNASEAFGKAFEEGNPHWFEAFIFRLIIEALTNLRYYLEKATDDAISWESPFVELQIPAEPEEPPLSAIPDEVLASAREATRAAGVRMDAVLLREVLRTLTRKAVTLREGGAEYDWIPSDLQKELDSWPKKKRERFLETYGDPFVIGGTYFEEGRDFEEGPEDEPQKLTRSGRKRLRDLVPLFFSGFRDEVPFSGSIAVAFHPLVLDEDAREAYFPVVAGIQFSPLEDGEEPRFPNPAEWTPEEREQFWTAILTPIHEAERSLRGKPAAAPESTQSPETEPPPPQGPSTTSTTAETPVTHTVDTMEVLQPNVLALARGKTVPAPESRKPPRMLWNAETRIPRSTARFIRHTGSVALPRKWSAIPKWEDLVEREIRSLQNLYGENAFCVTSDGPALIEKRTLQDRDPSTGRKATRTEVRLTREGERALEDREGLRGFIRQDRDRDGVTREFLVKVISAGDGRITLSVSWYGRALFFAHDGLERRREELEAIKRKWEQGDLFEDLPAKHRDIIDGLFENIAHVRNARILMDAISRRFGAEGENPLRYPAHDLKVLLECENDPNGMAKIQGSLRALQEVRFSIKATGAGSYQAFGPFLQHVAYEGRGPGRHGDGDFFLTISPDFIGCLKAFEVRVPSGRAVRAVFDWTRDLDKESEERLRREPFLKGFTISPYYDKAKKLTDKQSNLRAWLESQITRNSAPIPRHRKRLQLKRSPDAQRPRLYGPDFCPLIPEGKLMAGALGSFRKNPEAGWTLGGGAGSRATKTGGGHVEGLLSVIGYYYPPGAARAERQKVLRDALQDITVVVGGLHGVVAARTSTGAWVSLEEARKSLPEEELVKKVKWFFFLTPDLMGHMEDVVERYQAERHAKGETPFPIKITRDRREVEASRGRETAETLESRSETLEAGEAKVGLQWSPLWQRLRATVKDKGLTQTKAARLFGVVQQTFAGWIAGPERGYPIPEELVPLVKRWVDGGDPPSPEELASRKTKRPGVNPETGKPWTRPRKGTEAPPDDVE